MAPEEQYIEAIRSRDALMKLLESIPDEYEARLPALMGLCKLAPAIIEKDLMRTIYRIASENPVGAGRPPLIKSNEDKRKIVVAVGQLQIDRCFARGGTEEDRSALRHSACVLLRLFGEIARISRPPSRALFPTLLALLALFQS